MGKYKLIVGNPGDNRILEWPAINSSSITPFGKSGGTREEGTDHCRSLDGHTESFKDTGDWLYDLSVDLTESNNLAKKPEHADLITKMKQRLVAVGASGPPAAYVFTKPHGMKDAKAVVCDQMEKTGFYEPSDLTPHPAPTPAVPTPPTPGPSPGPAEHECKAAGGILDDDKIACCAAECGGCGGKQCGEMPGGNANCCRGEIEQNGKDCSKDKAPCSCSKADHPAL
jgi:hypothetical protein